MTYPGALEYCMDRCHRECRDRSDHPTCYDRCMRRCLSETSKTV